MTDEDILALWNEGIEATEELVRDHDHVAVEIPLGKPQLKYFESGDQWVPRGDVLRGEILGFDSGDPDSPFISIDDRDLSPVEFAKMMSTYGGWGVRMVFVPVDEVHDEPLIEVREPDDEDLEANDPE